jgi:hypothetical protein
MGTVMIDMEIKMFGLDFLVLGVGVIALILMAATADID